MAKSRKPSRYVALLAGINLGNRRVKMEVVRAAFTELGFTGVESFIASGNIIFESPPADVVKLEAKIEAGLLEALGYSVNTFLRTPPELADIVAHEPFAADELATPGHTLTIGFLRRAVESHAASELVGLGTTMDAFHIHGRELYWLCRGKTTDSLVPWPRLSKALGVAATHRNITTVRKLAELFR